ncbi:MAG: 4a-hydroxytetrahydrobiopterin dehydratase [Planctomycetaceae bacterium]
MSDDALTQSQIDGALQTLPGWELRDGWLRCKYRTPGWPHTLLLANTIGYLAEAANHHPDLELGYAQVIVKLQTHKVKAITGKDMELAAKIHEVATWLPAPESALDGFPKKWIH